MISPSEAKVFKRIFLPPISLRSIGRLSTLEFSTMSCFELHFIIVQKVLM